MNYKKMTLEQLQKYKYPNLMAELIESHYSICTLGDHMGLGRYREEDDPEIWAKLNGDKDILYNEAIGLAGLFGVKFEYLFSDKLSILCGKPMAVIRWSDYNTRMVREQRNREEIQKIERELKRNPELLEFMKTAMLLSPDSRKKLIEFMKREKEGDAA